MAPSLPRLFAAGSLLAGLLQAADPLPAHEPGTAPGRSEALGARSRPAAQDPACGCAAAAPRGEARLLPSLMERWQVDRSAVRRYWNLNGSLVRLDRRSALDRAYLEHLDHLDFDALGQEDRVDWLQFHRLLEARLEEAAEEREEAQELLETLPGARELFALEEERRELRFLEGREAGKRLRKIEALLSGAKERLEATPPEGERREGLRRLVASLRKTLDHWYEQYASFDPEFSWWCQEAREGVDRALEALAEAVPEEEEAAAPASPKYGLSGEPIGEAELRRILDREYLAYDARDLLRIGEEEFAWCEREMLRASRELGFGDDWRAALESVKENHVPLGEQDALVAGQAREAVAFLDEHGLVTIPRLCRETWRLEMIGEETQRTLPFAAYGGQHMMVAYPTEGMDWEEMLMAMRGNNVHFSRIVTPHELIPGHHLQGYMAKRWNTHRRPFRTPFYTEGWCLYWEMLFWDLGWPRDARDRIGMLFWRMHRCARIVVSLRFHLGEMDPDQMVDFLIERVGHERENAVAEVRRYLGGDYGPLYQCAYMIGALQLRALKEDLVDTGRMSLRAFHDAVLRANAMPIEYLRYLLAGTPICPHTRAHWRFYDAPAPPALPH